MESIPPAAKMQPAVSVTNPGPSGAGPSRTASSTSLVKPPVVIPGIGNNIIVNSCQRGNPVLECVKNVGKEFGDIVADYQVGRTTGVLFLSLKYHRLHPEYIHQRIERLGTSYNLRVLLIMCDVTEHQDPIRELTKICLINNVTVMVAWNAEEAGFYLSTYKQFEHKPPDLIKERVDKDYNPMLRTALTGISKVNKTDVEILRTSIGSFADIAKATSEQLLQLPGFGSVKVKRMKDAFDKPFRNSATSTILHHTQSLSQQHPEIATSEGPSSDKGKGKATELTASDRRREPSPDWDIELDLNSPSPDPTFDTELPAKAPSTSATDSRKRPVSPVWDIELDLNSSGVEDGVAEVSRKRHRADDEAEFEPTKLL